MSDIDESASSDKNNFQNKKRQKSEKKSNDEDDDKSDKSDEDDDKSNEDIEKSMDTKSACISTVCTKTTSVSTMKLFILFQIWITFVSLGEDQILLSHGCFDIDTINTLSKISNMFYHRNGKEIKGIYVGKKHGCVVFAIFLKNQQSSRH